MDKQQEIAALEKALKNYKMLDCEFTAKRIEQDLQRLKRAAGK